MDSQLVSFFPYILVLAAVAFFDDIFSLPAIPRLLLQIIIAGLVTYGGLALNSVVFFNFEIILPSFMGAIFTVVLIVWLVNLYNFMDGMDGFAAGMAVFGFSTFAVLAFMGGEPHFAVANLVVVSAALGFLVFNLPPSKIFMGDSGSTLIGMIVAVFSLWADYKHIFPLFISVIVFTPFILDSTVTLVNRLYCRKKIWIAHRSHYYQRLVLSGLGHKRTLTIEYIWMLFCSIVSIILFKADNLMTQLSVLSIFMLLCLVFLIFTNKKTSDIKI